MGISFAGIEVKVKGKKRVTQKIILSIIIQISNNNISDICERRKMSLSKEFDQDAVECQKIAALILLWSLHYIFDVQRTNLKSWSLDYIM